jgi:WD40 repeat protein
MALSPDGRYLAWATHDDAVRIRLYDMAGDRFVERFAAFKAVGQDLAFTAGGKTLVTVDHGDGMVRLWDVETGKEGGVFEPLRTRKRTNSTPSAGPRFPRMARHWQRLTLRTREA